MPAGCKEELLSVVDRHFDVVACLGHVFGLDVGLDRLRICDDLLRIRLCRRHLGGVDVTWDVYCQYTHFLGKRLEEKV